MARHTLVRLASLTAMLAAPTLLAAQMQSKALEPANMDTTCSACQDFYRYANGNWIKRSPIPADKPMWSSFHELQDQNFVALREVLDAAAKDARTTKDPDQRRLGLFYASCMDSTAIEAAGIKPLARDLGRIAAIGNRKQTEVELARLHRQFVTAGFFFHSTPDARKSERTIAEIYQSGLGLPDRDYYVKTDSASESLRAQYVDHVARVLRLAGDDSATAARGSRQVMELETALAKASMTQEAQRDPEAVYHLRSTAELRRSTPAFGWDAYFRELGLADPAQVNVAQPEFLAAVDSLLGSSPVEQWRTYLRWRLLDTASPFLSAAFVNEGFRFNSTVLQGTAEQQPRWKRCLQFTDNFMGEILGRAYVKKHFTPEAKARALEMVRNIQEEFRARLTRLTWMGNATKEKAYRKLDAIVNRIGYPDKWRDYSKLDIQPTILFTNVARASTFEARRDFAKVDQPTDRDEWGMTPPTVNASYNPLLNVITFPAGIMQPPFFDPKADDAVNYGGMGAVIGHEITHGFDDQGRQFDARGNLSGWWDSTDNTEFNRRAAVMEKQAGEYVAIDTLKVNGKLTLGENIADLGGLLIAYGAYRRSLEGKPAPAPIDGLTGDQRFFLAWAQIWRSNIRPEYARLLVSVDPHGPNAFRVNGPLSNMEAFAQSFGCKAGDPMLRPDSLRVQIW
jgi:predicted metalloendopeptidase